MPSHFPCFRIAYCKSFFPKKTSLLKLYLRSSKCIRSGHWISFQLDSSEKICPFLTNLYTYPILDVFVNPILRCMHFYGAALWSIGKRNPRTRQEASSCVFCPIVVWKTRPLSLDMARPMRTCHLATWLSAFKDCRKLLHLLAPAWHP